MTPTVDTVASVDALLRSFIACELQFVWPGHSLLAVL